jgi:hypothetical protein
MAGQTGRLRRRGADEAARLSGSRRLLFPLGRSSCPLQAALGLRRTQPAPQRGCCRMSRTWPPAVPRAAGPTSAGGTVRTARNGRGQPGPARPRSQPVPAARQRRAGQVARHRGSRDPPPLALPPPRPTASVSPGRPGACRGRRPTGRSVARGSPASALPDQPGAGPTRCQTCEPWRSFHSALGRASPCAGGRCRADASTTAHVPADPLRAAALFADQRVTVGSTIRPLRSDAVFMCIIGHQSRSTYISSAAVSVPGRIH